jgi:acyl carrier protein
MASVRGLLPGAPEIKPEHLGSLQTLEQVVAFLQGGNAEVTAAAGVAAAAQASVTAESSQTLPATDAVSRALLAVVAEKTGYPVEMLNLDMGMDSDLGIDSIKRVEIMAALRTQLPGSPEIKPEQLGSLQTLQQVVEFLSGPSAATQKPAASPPVAEAAPDDQPKAAPAIAPAAAQPATGVLRQIVKPADLPRVDAEEISLPRGALVWLTDDGSLLSSRIEGRLRARGLVVLRGDIAQKGFGNGGALPAALVIVSPAGGCKEGFLKQAFRLMARSSRRFRASTAPLASASPAPNTMPSAAAWPDW